MYGLYGKVTKCFHDKGFAFIYGEDGNSYFAHYSLLNGEHIERGYHVFFVPFRNNRSDYNAKNVSVIYTPEKEEKEKRNNRKKNNNRKHKPCNADILIGENNDLVNYDQQLCNENKDRFYITTKLCLFANMCKEIMFKKADNKEVCNYTVESFRHDLKAKTTKWELLR